MKHTINLNMTPQQRHIRDYYDKFPTKKHRIDYLKEQDRLKNEKRLKVDCSKFKFMNVLELSNEWMSIVWGLNKNLPFTEENKCKIELRMKDGSIHTPEIFWERKEFPYGDHGHTYTAVNMVPYVILQVFGDDLKIDLTEHKHGLRFIEYWKTEDQVLLEEVTREEI